MIPKECKRLAEVDFPIAVVSKHSAREKSIRHGHPSTLHLWWARRPLAACRSMLMALLLPDPCDPHCPVDFKTEARRILEDSRLPGKKPKTDADLRASLLAFIGDFADWDHSGNRSYLEVARSLVKAAHPDGPRLVVDPFAGGGSIPLEALRLGCDAFASDLNPVACLICKVLLEDIPRHGSELAEELRRVGAEVKKSAEKELAEFYPVDPDGARPIAYLWARTVRCEAPNCGAEIPLVRSFWLCKKAERKQALRPKVIREEGQVPRVEFELFVPKNDSEVGAGYTANGKARCPACSTVLAGQRVRSQLSLERGGGSPKFDEEGRRNGGARLMAVVTTNSATGGRGYRLPEKRDYEASFRVARRPLTDAPEEPINPIRPSPNARGLSAVTRFGVSTFGDLYTRRQMEALSVLSRIVAEFPVGPVKKALALVIGRVANAWTSVCRWHQSGEKIEGAFNGQKIPMVWDFAEAMPFSGATGGWDGAVDWVVGVVERSSAFPTAGQVQQADAAQPILADASASVWFTDPPYYDAVPYADRSDFFLVWLRRAFPELGRSDPYTPTNTLSPKTEECVWNQSWKDQEGQPKTRSFFEKKFLKVAVTGRKTLTDEGIACVVFAHKSTDGWEALLSGLITGGFVITASWPIITEMAQRTNARGTASLMGSVHLVCRPRPEDAPVGDWGQVLRELPKRVADWMNRLQEEGVRGADLVFACIGPALEVYSRYSKVVDAEERQIPLGGDPEARDPHKRGYLAYVWEVVGRAALEQVLGTAEAKARNGAAGALEEDARLTALFLWTLQATTQDSSSLRATDEEDAESDDEDEEDTPTSKKKKGLTLPFDVARRFAQPLGIHLDAWEGRCIATEKGVVRLVPVLDRAEQLFGEDGAEAVADRLEKHRAGPTQPTLFPLDDDPPPTPIKNRKRRSGAEVSDESLRRHRGATTLDHVHVAMLLQSSGRANALRALLKSEIERGPDFLRLANALSALYPKDSDEKRLLDAMLLAVPR
jgi:adenine-specific DNA methylase